RLEAPLLIPAGNRGKRAADAALFLSLSSGAPELLVEPGESEVKRLERRCGVAHLITALGEHGQLVAGDRRLRKTLCHRPSAPNEPDRNVRSGASCAQRPPDPVV